MPGAMLTRPSLTGTGKHAERRCGKPSSGVACPSQKGVALSRLDPQGSCLGSGDAPACRPENKNPIPVPPCWTENPFSVPPPRESLPASFFPAPKGRRTVATSGVPAQPGRNSWMTMRPNDPTPEGWRRNTTRSIDYTPGIRPPSPLPGRKKTGMIVPRVSLVRLRRPRFTRSHNP